jgi:signal transduction histidine kinase
LGAGLQARAELKRRQNTIQLSVSDSGKGFDVSHARRNGGLGLINMEERVRRVQGTMAVHSSPGQGTRVKLTVPYSKKKGTS